MTLKYFLDNDISPKIADILCGLDEDVTCLRREFPSDTPDEEWIPQVAAKGWVIVTVDHKILSRPAERMALQKHNAMAFFLAKSFLSLVLFEQGSKMLNVWPKIRAIAEGSAFGKLYRVQLNGKIEPLIPR